MRAEAPPACPPPGGGRTPRAIAGIDGTKSIVQVALRQGQANEQAGRSADFAATAAVNPVDKAATTPYKGQLPCIRVGIGGATAVVRSKGSVKVLSR